MRDIIRQNNCLIITAPVSISKNGYPISLYLDTPILSIQQQPQLSLPYGNVEAVLHPVSCTRLRIYSHYHASNLFLIPVSLVFAYIYIYMYIYIYINLILYMYTYLHISISPHGHLFEIFQQGPLKTSAFPKEFEDVFVTQLLTWSANGTTSKTVLFDARCFHNFGIKISLKHLNQNKLVTVPLWHGLFISRSVSLIIWKFRKLPGMCSQLGFQPLTTKRLKVLTCFALLRLETEAYEKGRDITTQNKKRTMKKDPTWPNRLISVQSVLATLGSEIAYHWQPLETYIHSWTLSILRFRDHILRHFGWFFSTVKFFRESWMELPINLPKNHTSVFSTHEMSRKSCSKYQQEFQKLGEYSQSSQSRFCRKT